MKGKFITFEGSEGSGKTTQILLLQKYLKKNKSVVFLREPGGTKISEYIRRILLDVKNDAMNDRAEMLLYMAARAQLVAQVIRSALQKGKIVLCDRFLDSTIAYQGYGSGVDIALIKRIGEFATQGLKPDLTFFFDLDVKTGFSRIGERARDRIEKRALVYHARVHAGFRKIAKNEPRRVKTIPGHLKKSEIQKIIRQHVDRLLGKSSK